MDFNEPSYQNSSMKESQLAQTIATSIQKISQNVSSMQRMESQLGTPHETSKLRNQLYELQHYTEDLVKDTSKHINELSTHVKDMSRMQSNTSQHSQSKMQCDRLIDGFTEALNRFQQAQRKAHEREKQILQRERASSGLAAGFLPEPGRDNLIELQDHGTSRQKQQQMLQDGVNLQDLEEQERVIQELESSIIGVNEVFKNLGQLVHEQGEKVDNIEAHVEQATCQVSEGAQQLRMANESQTKLRKRKLCLLMTFIVVLIVLILIIVWSTS